MVELSPFGPVALVRPRNELQLSDVEKLPMVSWDGAA
jgi:hypothetical protein